MGQVLLVQRDYICHAVSKDGLSNALTRPAVSGMLTQARNFARQRRGGARKEQEELPATNFSNGDTNDVQKDDQLVAEPPASAYR